VDTLNQLLPLFLWVLILGALAVRYVLTEDRLLDVPINRYGRNILVNICQRLRWTPIAASNRAYYMAAGALVLLALGVRIWEFGSLPGGFNQDGAMAAVDAKALADYGTDRLGMKFPVHFTAWGYGQMSVLLSYLMIPFIKLFGLHPWAVRMPILLVSIAGSVVLVAFSHRVWGRGIALFVLAFLAINPWHIMQSRWALDCNMYPHMFLLGLYFLYRSCERFKFIFPSMFFFAMCMYSYGIAFLSLPIFLLIACVIFIWEKAIPIKYLLLGFATYVFFSWPVWLTMLINTFHWSTITTPFFTMPFFPDSVRSNDIILFNPDKWEHLQKNLATVIRVLIRQEPDTPWNALDNYGSIFKCSIPLVVLGIIKLCKDWIFGREKMQRIGVALVLASVVMGFWIGLIVSDVNINRINAIFYSLILLCGVGAWQLFRWVRHTRFVLFAVYGILFCGFCVQYFGEFNLQISSVFNKGFGEAIHESQKIPFRTLHVTRIGLGNSSEVLTMFHANLDAHYIQGLPTKDPAMSQIPFREHYLFDNLDARPIDPQAPDAYIASQEELRFFSSDMFVIVPFQKFSLVFPKFMAKGTPLESKLKEEVGKVPLQLNLLQGTQDWGVLGVNGPAHESGRSPDPGFKIQGMYLPSGFGVHGESHYSYPLQGKYSWLTVSMGLSDDVACGDGVQFRILGDGTRLWESRTILNNELEQIRLSVVGVQELAFETSAGPNNQCDHANWIDPRLQP